MMSGLHSRMLLMVGSFAWTWAVVAASATVDCVVSFTLSNPNAWRVFEML